MMNKSVERQTPIDDPSAVGCSSNKSVKCQEPRDDPSADVGVMSVTFVEGQIPDAFCGSLQDDPSFSVGTSGASKTSVYSHKNIEFYAFRDEPYGIYK